jgi:hypothetical protein
LLPKQIPDDCERRDQSVMALTANHPSRTWPPDPDEVDGPFVSQREADMNIQVRPTDLNGRDFHSCSSFVWSMFTEHAH